MRSYDLTAAVWGRVLANSQLDMTERCPFEDKCNVKSAAIRTNAHATNADKMLKKTLKKLKQNRSKTVYVFQSWLISIRVLVFLFSAATEEKLIPA